MPKIVPKLLCTAIWCCCSIWFKPEQTSFPQTGNWNRSAALHRIWFGICCFVPMFFSSQRPMNDRKIEWSYGCCFDWQQLFPNSIRNFISHEIFFLLVAARYLQSIKTVLTLKLSQYRLYSKSDSTFSSSQPAATATDPETPCVCACLSDPPKLCWSAAPRAWPLILQSKPSIALCNNLREWLPDDWQGLKLGLKLELGSLTNGL